jgi:hypothetical protein
MSSVAMRRAKTSGILLNETIAIAFCSALTAAVAAAYQFGFQDPFGFTYISLGIEDIEAAMRDFLLPIVGAIAVALVIGYILASSIRLSESRYISDILFLLLPPAISIAFWIQMGDLSILNYLDASIPWILPAYYLLDISIWRALAKFLKGRMKVPEVGSYFRVAQVALCSVLVVAISYTHGRRDAYNIDYPTVCPSFGGSNFVLVQMTGSMAVCARADFEKSKVYQDVYYAQIPDGGEPKEFRRVQLHKRLEFDRSNISP